MRAWGSTDTVALTYQFLVGMKQPWTPQRLTVNAIEESSLNKRDG